MKQSTKVLVCCLVLISTILAPFCVLKAEASSEAIEIEELRTQNSDTVLLSDGTFECTIYSENKYYLNSEDWYVEIDNRIVEQPVIYKGTKFTYKNKEDSIDVCFQEDNPSLLLQDDAWAMALLFKGNEQKFDVEYKDDTITYYDNKGEYVISYRCDGRGAAIGVGICEGGTGEIWFDISSGLFVSIDDFGNIIFI